MQRIESLSNARREYETRSLGGGRWMIDDGDGNLEVWLNGVGVQHFCGRYEDPRHALCN